MSGGHQGFTLKFEDDVFAAAECVIVMKNCYAHINGRWVCGWSMEDSSLNSVVMLCRSLLVKSSVIQTSRKKGKLSNLRK